MAGYASGSWLVHCHCSVLDTASDGPSVFVPEGTQLWGQRAQGTPPCQWPQVMVVVVFCPAGHLVEGEVVWCGLTTPSKPLFAAP